MEVTEDVANRNQDGLRGWRKTQGNWVVVGRRMPRIEDAGNICFRRPRPTQGCRAGGGGGGDGGSGGKCVQNLLSENQKICDYFGMYY